MTWSTAVVIVFAAAMAAGERPAAAQSAGSQTSTPAVTAGWQDGFVLQSADGENRLVIGLTVQVDARLPIDSDETPPATFTVRKLRPTFSGRIAKYFEFKVMPDFGGGNVTLTDGYFDVRVSPRFRIRSGKDKTPVGYELLIGDPYLVFPERSIASLLVPNRDIGFQAQADPSPRVSFSGGVFNGLPDGVSSTTDLDQNGSKDLAGRIVWRPFRSASSPGGALNGLGFHIGGSIGDQHGALPSFRTLGGSTYFTYVVSATASGSRERVSPAAFYYHKSFGGYGEYMRSTQEVSRSGSTSTITNQGWEVTGSYVLTGEAASDRGVHPRHNLDFEHGDWGALQVAARYSELRIDPLAFTDGLASADANQRARAVTVAANWYPNAFIKYYVTFERTLLDGGVGRRKENVLLFRAQLAF